MTEVQIRRGDLVDTFRRDDEQYTIPRGRPFTDAEVLQVAMDRDRWAARYVNSRADYRARRQQRRLERKASGMLPGFGPAVPTQDELAERIRYDLDDPCPEDRRFREDVMARMAAYRETVRACLTPASFEDLQQRLFKGSLPREPTPLADYWHPWALKGRLLHTLVVIREQKGGE